MRKLIVAQHITLDGVIQAGGGPEEDKSGGFKLGGWQVPFDDDTGGEFVMELFSKPFELLLGRRTYDIWAGFWPKVPSDSPPGAIADAFNKTIKHVATRRPETLTWKNSQALKGNIVDAVRALKATNGPDLQTWGSGDMLRQLLAAGLVDELNLLTYPLVLGHGKRLFGDDALPSTFQMAHSAITKKGVVVARYVRAGDVRTGSYQA